MDKKALIQDLTTRMEGTLRVLDNELKGLRTGRASAHLLDPVIVEAYGDKVPISQLGTISTPDARTINVQVWDKSMVKTVEKAIADANLGVNTATDGQVIRVPVPPLSEDRRKDLVKLGYKYGENSKVAIRNIRRDGMDSAKKLEKDGSVSEDDLKKLEEEIQKLTDSFVSKIDEQIKIKEQNFCYICIVLESSTPR
jgi:ribosome recycling factor